MVVHGQHAIYAGKLKHLRIQPCRERLAIKFFAVLIVPFKVGDAVINSGTPVLRTVVKIGLYQHNLRRTVFFGAARNKQGAHREVLATYHTTGGTDDDHRLAF